MTMPDSGTLQGQVAIVTGASSGLGRATAVGMARAGADVAVLARDEGNLREVVSEVEGHGRSALALPVDLADEAAIHAAVRRVMDHYGRMDALVNNAATDVPGPVEMLSAADWDRVLDVNLRAPFLHARAVFPHMRQARRGTIVNVSSVAGRRGWANAAAYCASKFGLTGFTQALAPEGKPHNIRACILYPGGMATGWGTFSPEERRSQDRAASPPEESLPPEQVASLIVWIAAAPPELVLNEAVVTPLQEKGWP